MPRVLPTSASRYAWFKSLRRWWNDGSILLGLGWSGFAVVVLDRVLQEQQRREAQAVVDAVAYDAASQKRALVEQWRDQPALFACTVHREYKQMGGSHGLQGVRVGDVVRVLQEGVGPGGHYNLCRSLDDTETTEKEERVGWFPMSHLEKIEPPVSTTSFWRRIFVGGSPR